MAKDIYHHTVRTALEKDGWTITDDPLTLKVGGRSAFIDLGAEKLFAAEKEGQRIAVEVKSFISASRVKDLEQALGQYIMYSQILKQQNLDRTLYLAISQDVFSDFFSEELPQLMVELNNLKLLIFNIDSQEIVKWTT
jgi:XisH protein